MHRILILAALIVMLPMQVQAAGLTVTEEEAVITGIGASEWRLGNSEAEEAETKKELKEILTPQNAATAAPLDQRIQKFEADLQEALKKQVQTALNPFLVVNPAAKADVVKYEMLGAMNKPVGLRIGALASDEDVNEAKTALGIVEIDDSGDGKAYKMQTSSGLQWVRFDDVAFKFYYQNKCGEGYRTTDPAASDDYTEKVRDFAGAGSFQLRSPSSSTEYAPESSFDPGVNSDSTQQAVDLAADAGGGKGDVRMEVVVKLEGKVAMASSLAGLDSATPKDLASDFSCPCEAKSYLYVEDYKPPLPTGDSASSIAVSDFQKDTAVTGAAVGYAFAIPQVRHYKGDRTGAGIVDSNKAPVPLYGYPNGDGVNRDGYPGEDYTWKALTLKSTNPADDALNKTLNYEVGIGLGNRVKYLLDPANPTDPAKQCHMYWVPPRRPDSSKPWVGPYLGRVKLDSHQEVGLSVDKYSIDHPVTYKGEPTTSREFFSPFYKPVNFRNTPNLDGLCREVASLPGDPGETIQARRDTLKGKFPQYPNIAGISVKWGRECVQGITLGGQIKDDPSIDMLPYTMALPLGFASYENDDAMRHGSFDSSTVAENDPTGRQKSLVGTEAEGTSCPDCFFKVNAADCCSNDVVIASGTYGVEDNIKPTPILKLEEMDVRPGQSKHLVEVATVPNGPTGAGDPIGDYDYDMPYSRIHDSTVPLFNDTGVGVQGQDFKGYGNYSNNADEWDGRATAQTLQNPIDRDGKPFLKIRLASDEPPIEEDRRTTVTVAAEDNVAPTVDLPSGTDPEGRVRYAIAYLGYNFYYTGDDANAALTDDKIVHGGTVVNLDPKTVPQDDPRWERVPAETFEYNFRRPGHYVIEVTSIDRNANKRIMRVPVEVARLSTKFQAIDMENQRR